jgi:eukaryotic-like serine/threonine-protein kinase
MKKSYTISIPVRTFWRTVVPLAALVCVLGVLLGLFIVDRLIMPGVVHINKGTVSVPAIENLPFEEARQKLYDIGLYCDVQSREFNDKVPRDQVITQGPEAGTSVKKGRQVSVIVSKGPVVGQVPHVRKLTDRQAKQELRRNGFDLGKVRRNYSEDIEKDLIIRSDPEEGTTISREMPVDLYLSNGPRPTSAEVPNLVGETIGTARTKLEEAGLQLGIINNDNNASVAPGTVISQAISPGTSVPLESSVDLVVAVQK